MGRGHFAGWDGENEGGEREREAVALWKRWNVLQAINAAVQRAPLHKRYREDGSTLRRP